MVSEQTALREMLNGSLAGRRKVWRENGVGMARSAATLGSVSKLDGRRRERSRSPTRHERAWREKGLDGDWYGTESGNEGELE